MLDCLNAELLRRLPQMPYIAIVNIVCWCVTPLTWELSTALSRGDGHYCCCGVIIVSSGAKPGSIPGFDPRTSLTSAPPVILEPRRNGGN